MVQKAGCLARDGERARDDVALTKQLTSII